jgi:hypothetical protein
MASNNESCPAVTEMIHSKPMEYSIADVIRVVATEIQRMEEYGLRYLADDRETAGIRQQWTDLEEQFSTGTWMPSMDLLHAAGRLGKKLVSDVDHRISVIASSYTQAVDFAFNIFGIGIDGTVNRDAIVSPLTKSRRIISSPASSKSGSRGEPTGRALSPHRIRQVGNLSSNYSANTNGSGMEDWQHEEAFKEIMRIQAAMVPATQPPGSVKSDLSQDSNRYRESPQDLKRLIFTNP